MANKNILAKKQTVIDEIVEKVQNHASLVVFEYHGLTVDETNELRKALRATGSELKVYKNTLAKRALDSLNIDLKDELNGPKAFAFGTDSIAPIKVLSDFAKDHPALELKVGYVDGSIAGIELLKEYAAIPSREGLLTMFAGGLMQIVKDFAICLDLHSQNLEQK